MTDSNISSNNNNSNQESAIFAGGCFWCTEAVFLELNGVQSVLPGYIGGQIPNPTYSEICTGMTGHAEAVKIIFDSQIISFEDLLDVFFATHDPTTLNRQGNDVGTQYRSEIFFTNNNQKNSALNFIESLNKDLKFVDPIVTKISPASVFFVAEEYHKNYYNQNKSQGYCSYIITPKIKKLRDKFQHKLKK